MSAKTLNVEQRDAVGSSAMQRLRKKGYIPGVVYSEGKPAQPLAVEALHFQKTITGSGSTQLYKFKSKATTLDGLSILIKAMQFEPVKSQVLHIDFFSVSEGHKITVTVPIELTGDAPGVKQGDLILNQATHELEVECLPNIIPDKIQVDLSNLEEGHSIHAADVALPEGVILKSDPSLTIVSTITKKAEEVIAPPVAAVPAAAGAAATPGKEEGKTTTPTSTS